MYKSKSKIHQVLLHCFLILQSFHLKQNTISQRLRNQSFKFVESHLDPHKCQVNSQLEIVP